MLRSGFILSVSIPAAILTLMVHPMIRDTADHGFVSAARAEPVSRPAPASLPGMRPVSLAISPTRVAGVPRMESRSTPVATQGIEPADRPALRPQRRMVREGCETALSSLVGPEARRMAPGRCIS